MFSVFISTLLTLIGCDSEPVDYQNTNPVASITSHVNGEEVYDGETITLLGSVSDADNSNSDIAVSWFVAGEEVCTEDLPPDGTTECEVVIIESSDLYDTNVGNISQVHLNDGMVMLYVKDLDGAVGTATVTLVIIDTPTSAVETSRRRILLGDWKNRNN